MTDAAMLLCSLDNSVVLSHLVWGAQSFGDSQRTTEATDISCRQLLCLLLVHTLAQLSLKPSPFYCANSSVL